MNEKTAPPQEQRDQQRVTAAVSGVRAVESMNMEIEALRRELSQKNNTIANQRAELLAKTEANSRLQTERDHFMNLVAQTHTQIESVTAAMNMLLGKINSGLSPETAKDLGQLIDQITQDGAKKESAQAFTEEKETKK